MTGPVGTQGLLGCCQNTATIWDRCESRKIADLDDLTCVQWSRELDAVSEATVTAGRTGACCDKIAELQPWRHELVIYRCGRKVWSGPILEINYTTTSATIVARDRLAWFDRYEVGDLSLSGLNTDIAAALIEHGLEESDGSHTDDPCIASFLEFYPGDFNVYSYSYEGCQTTVGAELRNLARGSLNFTAIDRRVLVWSGLALSRTAMLQDKHLLGEVSVTVHGYDMGTWACVKGNAVSAECGGRDPYYGRLERSIRDDSITDVATARAVGCTAVATHRMPSVTLDIPDGVRLDPAAPVTIDQLVPGVVIPFWSESTCRTVNQDLALTKVQVTQGCSDDAQGEEQVLITVGPRAILAEGDFTAVANL